MVWLAFYVLWALEKKNWYLYYSKVCQWPKILNSKCFDYRKVFTYLQDSLLCNPKMGCSPSELCLRKACSDIPQFCKDMCLVLIGLITYTPCDWTFSYATHHTTLHSVTMLYFCMFCESALMNLQLIIFPIFFKKYLQWWAEKVPSQSVWWHRKMWRNLTKSDEGVTWERRLW